MTVCLLIATIDRPGWNRKHHQLGVGDRNQYQGRSWTLDGLRRKDANNDGAK